MRPQVGTRCLLSPAWRHQSQVHRGAAPLQWAHGCGNPKRLRHPPGTTSCLTSRAPWSPHLFRAGVGRLGAQSCSHAFHPLCASLPWPDVQGREGTAGGHGTPTLPPVHGNHRARAAGGARDPYLRESAQAFGGKSLTSRAESGPRDPEPCRCVLPCLLGPISHLSPRNLVEGKVRALGF